MNFRPFWLVAAAGLLAVSVRSQESPSPSWVDLLHLTASGGISKINNISRTSGQATRKDATIFEFGLGGSQSRQLTRNLLLVASAEAASLHVPDYELTDNSRLGGRISLQSKFGLGAQATVLQFHAGSTYKSARFSADRGWTSDAGLQLSKRVLPSLRLAASAGLLEHAARSAVFDLHQHSLSAEARWDINRRWTLSGNATRLGGDIVANASGPVWAQAIGGGFGQKVSGYYTSRPWDVTHLYGLNWVSYNVEADVDLWSVTLAFAFSDRTAVELRKVGAYIVNRIGVTYPTDSWGLSLMHRF
jgi:hypothetical protein